MKFADLLYVEQKGVATITLNRPDTLNALSDNLLSELVSALRQADDDDCVRCVILTGAGRSFCAGADLKETALKLKSKEFQEPAQQDRNLHMEPLGMWARVERQLRTMHKPIIAAVNGLAVGGGLMLAAACDIRIAAESARFCAIFARRGLSFEAGTSYYLPRLIGIEQTFRMVYTADMYSAEKALAIGLVSEVVNDGDLQESAHELAKKIAAFPTFQLGIARRQVLMGSHSHDPENQMMVEMFALGQASRTHDYHEGHLSFAERRDPQFKGY